MLTIEEAAARGRIMLLDAVAYDADPDWWDEQVRVAGTHLAVRGRDGICRWDFTHRAMTPPARMPS